MNLVPVLSPLLRCLLPPLFSHSFPVPFFIFHISVFCFRFAKVKSPSLFLFIQSHKANDPQEYQGAMSAQRATWQREVSMTPDRAPAASVATPRYF